MAKIEPGWLCVVRILLAQGCAMAIVYLFGRYDSGKMSLDNFSIAAIVLTVLIVGLISFPEVMIERGK